MNKEVFKQTSDVKESYSPDNGGRPTLADLSIVKLYYEEEKEKYRLILDLLSVSEKEKLNIYKKLSLYSIKIITLTSVSYKSDTF